MRNAFAREMVVAAERDARVVLLSGDIGNRLFDPFKERFRDRFFNCGVAEANMMSMAAGLALCGLRPVVYTIVPFVTTRCLEQIRVDVCYHNVPVVIVGVGGGLSYASLGSTHHACEDIALLRVLPGMSVICPGDPHEVRAAMRAALAAPGPVYVRLGKKGEPNVHAQEPELVLGRSLPLRSGTRVAILAVGHLLPMAVTIGEQLAAAGITPRIDSFHTVKPLDEACLRQVFADFEVVVTLEEHSLIGGAGAAVAEWLARQAPQRAKLCSFGTPDRFLHKAGSVHFARAACGLEPETIAQTILRTVAS